MICRPAGCVSFFFLMIRRPPRSTLDRSSAASDVYKRQVDIGATSRAEAEEVVSLGDVVTYQAEYQELLNGLSLIHISEPTRPY